MGSLLAWFDRLIKGFDDGDFEKIMRHIGRLGAAAVVFAGGTGMYLHGFESTGFGQVASIAFGALAMLGAFFLIVLIGFGAWKDVRNAVASTWLGHCIGVLVFLAIVFVAIGGMFFTVRGIHGSGSHDCAGRS